ncbi:MAG: chorismate mutase [Polyangiaceae bacterium]|nr:chorismate mutase [Polyangiaceae bacterium]
MQDRLEELRREIDRLDDEILRLIAQRLERVLAVGDYKREHAVAVYDPERERRILERLVAQAPAPLEPDIVRRVFERVIDESRRAEQARVRAR